MDFLTNPFKDIKEYKQMLLIASFIVFVLSISINIKLFDATVLALFSAATFLLLIAQGISFKRITDRQNMGKCIRVQRKRVFKPTALGICLFIICAALYITGFYKLLRYLL